MREELAKAKIEALKRQLVPVILRPIEQLSVRQAGRLTGLNASTIARLRRGLEGYITLEGLVEAAMKLGVPVKITVRKPRRRVRKNPQVTGQMRKTRSEKDPM